MAVWANVVGLAGWGAPLGEHSSAKSYMKKHLKGLWGRERGHLASLCYGVSSYAGNSVLGALSPEVLLKVGQG